MVRELGRELRRELGRGGSRDIGERKGRGKERWWMKGRQADR